MKKREAPKKWNDWEMYLAPYYKYIDLDGKRQKVLCTDGIIFAQKMMMKFLNEEVKKTKKIEAASRELVKLISHDTTHANKTH
jgi:hypothetical protein